MSKGIHTEYKATTAELQSGYAADCKSVYAGSIPTSASIFERHNAQLSWALASQSPGGEIGRRKGLKIPRRVISVPVRFRPRAPLNPIKPLKNKCFLKYSPLCCDHQLCLIISSFG